MLRRVANLNQAKTPLPGGVLAIRGASCLGELLLQRFQLGKAVILGIERTSPCPYRLSPICMT
jgi:hypothetical protein